MKISRDRFSATVLLLVAALFMGNWAWSAADYGNTSVISPTDASNASGTMPSWSGSAAPSTIDDAGRALQGSTGRWWEATNFTVTSSGTAPTFVVAYTVAPAALRSGQNYCWTSNAAAAGTDTANINTLGAKTLKKVISGSKTNLAANDFYAGEKLCFAYDGTDLVWSNRPGGTTYTVNGLTEETAPAVADMLGGYDTSGAVERKFSITNIWKTITGLTAETAPAIDDELPIYDLSATTGDKITLANFLKVVNGLTEDTSPDTAADFVLTYDTSASAAKKVKPSNLTSGGITLTAEQTATGTAIDFTSIPSTVKRITIMFEEVSPNNSSNFWIQLGDSGGFEATGYNSSGTSITSGASPTASQEVTAFQIGADNALSSGNQYSGAVTLTLQDSTSNRWIAVGQIMTPAGGEIFLTTGQKALSATLDRVRLTLPSSHQFDAGVISIQYQ